MDAVEIFRRGEQRAEASGRPLAFPSGEGAECNEANEV